MRFRMISLNNVLGITRAKKRFNRATGITAIKRPFRAPGNYQRRVLRHAGYYSGPLKFLRLIFRLF